MTKQQKKFTEDKQLQEFHRLQMVRTQKKKEKRLFMYIYTERYGCTKEQGTRKRTRFLFKEFRTCEG